MHLVIVLNVAVLVDIEVTHTLDVELSAVAAVMIVQQIVLVLILNVLILAFTQVMEDMPVHQELHVMLNHTLLCAAVHLALRVTHTLELDVDQNLNLSVLETEIVHQHWLVLAINVKNRVENLNLAMHLPDVLLCQIHYQFGQ
jgi:hypothetical protein